MVKNITNTARLWSGREDTKVVFYRCVCVSLIKRGRLLRRANNTVLNKRPHARIKQSTKPQDKLNLFCHWVFKVNDMYRARDQSCELTVTSWPSDILTCVTSSLLQIDQRKSVKSSVTKLRPHCQMEITKYLLFICVLHLSAFYSHVNVTSVKVSEFYQSAKLVF